jgi:hypothetical protein
MMSGADRKATADRLAERGEIGGDAIGGTEAAEGEAERDDLVDDHERAVAGSELADSVDELRVGGLEASAVRHEVDEDRGDLRTARIEELPKRRTVALREHDDRLALGIRDAGLVEVSYRIRCAVVAPLEPDDHIASGDSAGATDGLHDRFCSRVAEPPVFVACAIPQVLGEDNFAPRR